MSSRRITLIKALLILLTLWDLLLSSVCILFPNTWFNIFHGVDYAGNDLVGLLKRTGAVWAAFTLFQLIAYFKWQKQPYWLPLVAGIRLTEVFSDWTYILVAHPNMTWFGYLGLGIAPPSNVLFGWFLIVSYLKMERET